MISTDINANTGVVAAVSSSTTKMSESTFNQLQKLQSKVRALEQANAELREHRESYAGLDSSGPSSPERRGSRALSPEEEGGAFASGPASGHASRKQSTAGMLDDVHLIDLNSLEGTEADWLIDSKDGDESFGHDLDSCLEWLRTDVERSDIRPEKINLVSRLDEMAKRSPVHSLYSPNSSASSRGSPLYPYLASTPARALPPTRGYTSRAGGFDPRTFSRGTKLPAGLNLDGDEEDIGRRQSRDNGYHRLAFGPTQLNTTTDIDTNNGPILNRTMDLVDGPEPAPFLRPGLADAAAIRPHNATFSSNLNNTFEKIASSGVNNATFDSDPVNNEPPNTTARINTTFNSRSPNKTFETDAKHVLNTTFDSGTKISPPQAAAEPVIRPAAASDADRYQRKMSEDRLSSASSSNRLSRGSSNDGLLEDMEVLSADIDRLSTASNMSESSASHRLNDVQDVQDLARRQEESLRHPPSSYQPRSATMSPSSEGSLISPQQEEGGGYQSEESCGSEGGRDPRRDEKRSNPPFRQYGTYNKKQLRNSKAQYNNQYNNTQYTSQQYSSQDSLPDSPYSSQSLDSHSSQQGPDKHRSMPNLNQRGRGRSSSGVGGGAGATSNHAQYGLSKAKHSTSAGRLQQPSRLQGPNRVSSGNLRAPTATAVPQIKPPATNPTFAKPEPVRKFSGIARPSSGGLPRPSGISRLPAPGGAGGRSGIARGGPSGVARRTGSVGPSSRIGGYANGRPTTNQNWQEDCY